MNYPCDLNQTFMLNSLVSADLAYLFQSNLKCVLLNSFYLKKFELLLIFHICNITQGTYHCVISHSKVLHFVFKKIKTKHTEG